MVNKGDKKFLLLSGLPRSGSTLLVALLAQNPEIYGEGLSALCQLMWNAKQACETDAIAANNRFSTKHDVLSALPYLYYKDVEQPIIIEKGRTWTHPLNLEMWSESVCSDQKVVVLVRPMEDVMKSMAALRLKNGWQGDLYTDLLEYGSEPIFRAAEAIQLAKTQFSERLLFIDYRDLIADPLGQIGRIYELYGLNVFAHYVEGIEHKRPENDAVHGLIGMHDVRSTISVRDIDIELPDFVKAACVKLDTLVYGA
jgi:sulfotransferase